MKKISDEQMDTLKEISNIGSGNAATALSQILKEKINISVPNVVFCEIEKASEQFGAPETPVVAVYMQLLGDATGIILIPFLIEDAKKLSALLLGEKQKKTIPWGEMAHSALNEVAVILAGAYLSALSKMLKMRMLVSAPLMAEDMSGALVENILIETSKEAEQVILVETELNIVGEKITTNFFFIPDIESMGKIMKIIGVD